MPKWYQIDVKMMSTIKIYISPTTFMFWVSFSPAPECVIVALVESTFSDPHAAQPSYCCYYCCVVPLFLLCWPLATWWFTAWSGHQVKVYGLTAVRPNAPTWAWTLYGVWRKPYHLRRLYMVFDIKHTICSFVHLYMFSFVPSHGKTCQSLANKANIWAGS